MVERPLKKTLVWLDPTSSRAPGWVTVDLPPRMAIADGGELIVLAPALKSSVRIKRLITLSESTATTVHRLH